MRNAGVDAMILAKIRELRERAKAPVSALKRATKSLSQEDNILHNQEENTMYEIKVETSRKIESTLDPSVTQLIEELALALQSHHTGLVTTEPFARTYERDRVLLNKVEDFLMIAEEVTQ